MRHLRLLLKSGTSTSSPFELAETIEDSDPNGDSGNLSWRALPLEVDATLQEGHSQKLAREAWEQFQHKLFNSKIPYVLRSDDIPRIEEASLASAESFLGFGTEQRLREVIGFKHRDGLLLRLEEADKYNFDVAFCPWEWLATILRPAQSDPSGVTNGSVDSIIPYRGYQHPVERVRARDETHQGLIPVDKLRVLVIVDGPTGPSDISAGVTEVHIQTLRRELTTIKSFDCIDKIEVLGGKRRNEITPRLYESGANWNVVIWFGHLPLNGNGPPTAVLADKGGESWPAEEFAADLHSLRDLRLVVLSACMASQVIAPSMIKVGIPAVMANQLLVNTDTQPKWISNFLTALARPVWKGEPWTYGRIDLAFQEMRKKLDPWERGIPVLHVVGRKFKVLEAPHPTGMHVPCLISPELRVRQASRMEIKVIAQQEAINFTLEDAIPHDILLRWYDRNPSGFNVLLSDSGEICGHLDILPVMEKAMENLGSGAIREREITPEQIYTEEQQRDITALYVESLFTPPNASLRYILRYYNDIIKRICNPDQIIWVYAMAATLAGEELIKKGLHFQVFEPPAPVHAAAHQHSLYRIRFKELIKQTCL